MSFVPFNVFNVFNGFNEVQSREVIDEHVPLLRSGCTQVMRNQANPPPPLHEGESNSRLWNEKNRVRIVDTYLYTMR